MYHRILKKILLKFLNFWLFFWMFLAIPLNIRKKFVAEGKLRLRLRCLAMCLIFQENPDSRAYKLVAYKKNCVHIKFSECALFICFLQFQKVGLSKALCPLAAVTLKH